MIFRLSLVEKNKSGTVIKMETESTETTQTRLTVDMGPEKLDRVPEHLLKKRKKYQGLYVYLWQHVENLKLSVMLIQVIY